MPALRFLIGFYLLTVVLLAQGAVAVANPLETYGFGSRAISLAGAYSAVSDDFAAVLYNPAGLPQIGDADLGFGMTFLHADFRSIEDVVVGETLEHEAVVGRVDTDACDNGGFMGGVAVGITDDIAVGVGFYLPSTSYLAKLQSQNQREPNYLWYEKRPMRFAMLVSAGARIYKGLHIGAGMDILFGPEGQINLRVPAGGEGTADLALTFRPRISPYAGLLYKMKNGMRFAAVYREKKDQGEVDLTLHAQIETELLVIPLAGKLESMIFYSPRQVTLGWAWTLLQDRLSLSLDLAWLQWSQFEDATLAVVLEVGPGGASVPFQQVLDPGFHDTLLPRVGAEVTAKRWSGFPLADQVELLVRGGVLLPAITGSGADRGDQLPGQ